VGKTLNIGSGGILFTTEETLPMGRQVEVSVNWPARLDGACPLQFVVVGRVVRSKCQGRMKIPQIAGRKVPTPHQVVVDANRHFSEHG